MGVFGVLRPTLGGVCVLLKATRGRQFCASRERCGVAILKAKMGEFDAVKFHTRWPCRSCIFEMGATFFTCFWTIKGELGGFVGVALRLADAQVVEQQAPSRGDRRVSEDPDL